MTQEALAQTQEPAATLAVRWHAPVGKVAYVLEVNLPLGIHKLYPTPPQRTWVGLTNEEKSGFTQHEMAVVKYVSKVLQEKNT